MRSLKKDTLAYQLGVRPYTNLHDLSGVSTSHIALDIHAALDKGLYSAGYKGVSALVTGVPEVEALSYYIMNHAVALIMKEKHPLEPLGKYLPVVEEYNLVLAEQTRRMFHYLVAICTRESRHNKSDYTFWEKTTELFGHGVSGFYNEIKNSGSTGAVTKFCAKPPEVSLGVYTSYLSHAFFKGYYGGGYGGPAWGAIADVLRKFVHGEYTPEMMLDTAYTLCHNNGPIFNKGMFYDKYSNDLYKILDVQRAGQIPQLIAENKLSSAQTVAVQARFNLVKELLGDLLLAGNDTVDWFAVESAGALKDYTYEKKEQTKNSEKETTSGVIHGHNKKQLEITPGCYVEILEVDRV